MANPSSRMHLANNSEQPINGMFEQYFLDYASYVILERAVPALADGLKPVQRRILHALREMEDGRFHKVANVIGQTMQYHPHGDAAIGEALVNIGQKELLLDCQGNWGDIRTGDSAAAARYIETRLTKFALEIGFNPVTTNYQLTYDGRKEEPIALSVKFPLLLAQGVEGIAVGLATKILPHNFIELLKAAIDLLKEKEIKLLPDFPTAGLMDASDYNSGMRGGKVRVRARIVELDKKTLSIQEIPFGTTTGSLIDSIVKAGEKGKIKIKKVVDNTAAEVAIIIELQPGASPDMTIDALYAFTDCELSHSPNACVIVDDKPMFLPVEEILRLNVAHTQDLLRQELEWKKRDLEDKWHSASLEKIFIQNRIYRDIEESDSWQAAQAAIRQGLAPFLGQIRRPVSEEDIVRLAEIRIRRISRYNSFEADEYLRSLETEEAQTLHHLAHLTDYTIDWFSHLLKKYGKGRERKTEIVAFDTINSVSVVAKNAKLYVNYEEGFVGTSLKKDVFLVECSDLDDIIGFRRDGKYIIKRIEEKAFFGKDLIHVAIWKKGDDRTTYNVLYTDGATGRTFAKRFQVSAITRDKEYDLTQGTPNSRVFYFSANPDGEAEVLELQLSPGSKVRSKTFLYNFADLDIKGRTAQGNLLVKQSLYSYKVESKTGSTLSGLQLFYDESIGRLNNQGQGKALGVFTNGDKLLAMYANGNYELTDYSLTNRYEAKLLSALAKFDPQAVVSIIYYDEDKKANYLKRFKIETTTLNQSFAWIPTGSTAVKLLFYSTDAEPVVQINYKGKAKGTDSPLALAELEEVKNPKAVGTKISEDIILSVRPLTKKAANSADKKISIGDTLEFDL